MTKQGTIKSDPLYNYAIQDDGSLKLLQTFAAGGANPRHFSMSKDGTLVVTALQEDGKTNGSVALIKRDVASGKLVEFIGAVTLPGSPNFAKFKE